MNFTNSHLRLKSFILITSIIFSNHLFSQINDSSQYVWVSGDKTKYHYGVYGIKGVSSNKNMPGSRWGAVSWMDQNGNLWIFGGTGYGSSFSGYLNDLWKYSTSTNNWTWISGDSIPDQEGVYGTQGVESVANKPGGRSNASSWFYGNELWLFGGTDRGGFWNDLWRFNIGSNQWSWRKGPNYPNGAGLASGSPGEYVPSNLPASRWSATSSSRGNIFYLFGGAGDYGSSELDDLWEYDANTNNWAYLYVTTTLTESGLYKRNNGRPGSRAFAVSWADQFYLYLFGGIGYANSLLSKGSLNDLWRYDFSLNKWNWIKGDSLVNSPGYFGTKGISSSKNSPFSTFTATACKDINGNLLLFGGAGGYVIADTIVSGSTNDLWSYNPSTNSWTWLKGSKFFDQNDKYGKKGVPSLTNQIGSRYGAISQINSNGDLLIWGGANDLGYENDLWICANQFPGLRSNATYSSSIENNNKEQKIIISPNPVKNYLYAEVNFDGDAFVSITDMQGKKVMFFKTNVQKNGLITIDTKNIAKGVYNINISTINETHFNRMFMKE